MLKILAFFENIGRLCARQRLNVLRILAVLLLVSAFTLGFILPPGRGNQAGTAEEAVGQNPEFTAEEQGIGGARLDRDNVQEPLPQIISAGARESQSIRILLYRDHVVKTGDIVGDLAINFNLNEDTILSVNGIKNSRLLQIGQVLRIPNQDGIVSAVEQGDTIYSLAEKYGSDAEAIRVANQLFSDAVRPETALFIPGGRLSWEERQERNGDLFIWPVTGRISSNFGWRSDPFGARGREFHNGLDIAALMGTPVRASMAGRVSSAGFDTVFGNFIIITHSRGFRTLYGHMSRLRVRQGDYVGSGQQIGDVGSTGRSTGPHLHFSVYDQGTTVNPRTVLPR